MFHKPVSGLSGIALLLLFAASAAAQDFRVYTKIYDIRGTTPKLVGRSTSLFHAGVVYDYLDGDQQMTICEPAHEQFVIIDDARRRKTVVPYEYIEHRLFTAASRTEEKIGELRRQRDTRAKDIADRLQFQLAPRFKETFDEKECVLSLKSPFLSYEVKCQRIDSDELRNGYLNYTDWAQRLNFLVNPHAMLPPPRLALNEALRRRQLLPVKVTLNTNSSDGRKLRAEHRFDWRLDPSDMKRITYWERLQGAPDLKEVAPHQLFEPEAGDKTANRR